MLPIGCIAQGCLDILNCQLRKILKNFIRCHARRKPSQNITHRNSKAPNAGSAETDFRVNRDYLRVVCHPCKFNLTWQLHELQATVKPV